MKANILEYSDAGSTPRGAIDIPLEPPSYIQTVEVGSDSIQSAAFDMDTCIVKLVSDVDCVFEVGLDPDATNSFRSLMAGKEQTIVVTKGQDMKVAIKASSTASGMGTLEALLKLITSPEDAKAQIMALSAQTSKLDAASAKLSQSIADDTALKADILKATVEINDRHLAIEKTASGLAAMQAGIDKAKDDHEVSVAAFTEHSDAKTAELNQREAELNEKDAALGGQDIQLKALEARLAAREVSIAVNEEAVTNLRAEYAGKLAQLKELAG